MFGISTTAEKTKEALMHDVNAMLINHVTTFCYRKLELDYSLPELTADDSDKLNQCCAKVFTALEEISLHRKQGQHRAS